MTMTFVGNENSLEELLKTSDELIERMNLRIQISKAILGKE